MSIGGTWLVGLEAHLPGLLGKLLDLLFGSELGDASNEDLYNQIDGQEKAHTIHWPYESGRS
jgi:hypothetical protein